MSTFTLLILDSKSDQPIKHVDCGHAGNCCGEEQSIASVFESEAHTPYVVKCLLFSFLIFTPPVARRGPSSDNVTTEERGHHNTTKQWVIPYFETQSYVKATERTISYTIEYLCIARF